MTIKKRLFISNILMIVIPVVVSVVTMGVVMFALNGLFHGTLHDVIREAETEREQMFSESFETVKAQMVMVALLFVAALFLLIYFTNRFLTRFVFRKVEQPLEMLSDGVRHIKEGNLNYRIVYNSEDEFKPICEDFNEMAARLKTSVDETLKNERSRKELIAGISHDLRSPLTSIKAYAEGLLDGVAVTPAAQRAYLQIIKAKTDDVNHLVSQLFLFSKMDMGDYPVNLERLDIGQELSGFAVAVAEDYQARGLMVVCGELPKNTYILADPTQLRRVFTNILDNSAKYRSKEAAQAEISCAAKNGAIKIIFDDNGAGVAAYALPKLFDVRFLAVRKNAAGFGLYTYMSRIYFVGLLTARRFQPLILREVGFYVRYQHIG
ncbi:hypothetical protein FACS1894127_3110 [Clostridia bacterium]|nr:hypothetical protein FACS1894127_3110 [Clostridia bacterium]